MVTLSNVTKYYGAFRAVDALSLEIREGEITGLLGPNGAGKTTTMRMITGYFKPSAGVVKVAGRDVVKDPGRVKSVIGYLPESPPLYGEMMTFDYLRFAAGIRGIFDERRIIETAETCGIVTVLHKRIDQLSKGYRQRVGLAQAILHDPEILILDEPTSGLDPNQIAEVRSLIRRIGKTKTVILSTHILQEVEAIADRVVIINDGRIVEDGLTGSLQEVRDGRYVVRAAVSGEGQVTAPDLFGKLPGVLETTRTEGEPGLETVRITASAGQDVRPLIFRAAAERGWTLFELSREKHSLEAIFRELTGADPAPAEGGDHGQHL